jgi:hypothetical protein
MKRDRIPPPGPVAYLQAFVGDWFAIISGGLSVPLTIYSLSQNTPFAKGIWGSIAVIGFLLAGYRIWGKERTRVLELHGRPELTIETIRIGGAMDGRYLFRLHNSSDNAATRVILSPITSQKGVLVAEFTMVASVIKSPVGADMGYAIKVASTGKPVTGPGNDDLLQTFSLDMTPQGCLTSYPTHLEFSNYGDEDRWQMDYTLELLLEEKQILCVPGQCRKITV